jgi:hypothetical protein
MQGILINREKATGELLELQQSLIRRNTGEKIRGHNPIVASVSKKQRLFS